LPSSRPANACERGTDMALIILAAVVAVLLFIYLLAALLRPEWF
jgi:K+-transporting ATPase KdpF subunit